MFKPIRNCALASVLLLSLPAFAQTTPEPDPNLQLQAPGSGGGFVPAKIYATLRQPDGKVLVGGDFTRLADGTPRTRLLRLNVDGSLDSSFAPAINSLVSACVIYALAWSNGSIYVGGTFDTINGSSSPNVARITSTGALASGWASPFPQTSPGEVIRALAATPTSLFIGGDIQRHDAFGLARLDAINGGWDFSWIAQTQNGSVNNPPTGGTRGQVRALLANAGDLLVGGDFLKIANLQVRGLARISQSAPVSVNAFDTGLSASGYRVSALHADGARLYIGGNFFRQSAPFVDYLNRVDINSGALDSTWQPQTNGSIDALALDGGMLYVGGSFSNAIPPSGGNRLIRVATTGNGAIDSTWNPSMNNSVLALTHNCRSRMIAGGDFDVAGGVARNGLAGYLVANADCIFASGFEMQ